MCCDACGVGALKMPHFGTILALRHPLEELGSNGEAAQHQACNNHTNSGHGAECGGRREQQCM